MPTVTLIRQIDSPVSEVWSAWDDYAHIDRFNPNLKRSFLLDEGQPTGMGATRQCDLSDGKNYIQERIIDYVPQKRILIDIYDGTLPLESARAEITMRALGTDRTELQFTMNFVPKYGMLGRLMVPLLKSQFRKLLGRLMDANQAYIEDGIRVDRAA